MAAAGGSWKGGKFVPSMSNFIERGELPPSAAEARAAGFDAAAFNAQLAQARATREANRDRLISINFRDTTARRNEIRRINASIKRGER